MLTANSQNAENDLAMDIGSFAEDPLGYVLYNFPWGVEGTPLEKHKGPRKWQRKVLIALGEAIKDRAFDGETAVMPVELSVSSGHGIGKTCLAAWIIKFMFDTRPHSRGTVTSNTIPQLFTKTWSELGKWHNMSLTKHWSRLHHSKANMGLVSYVHSSDWYVYGQTCKEENSESFAGQHAETSSSWYLFDEASAVPDKIWEVSDGGLTDGEPFRISFGNPTKNTGRFIELHKKRKSRKNVISLQIDSRDVEGTNKALIQEWIDYYGEDHDFVRVRVRGLPPKQASMQLISTEDIEKSALIDPMSHVGDPLIMGVDIARFGDDHFVITWRRGRDARTIKKIKLLGVDTMTLASIVVKHARGSDHTSQQIADGVMIDGTGVGGGVVDRCRQLGLDVVDVQFAAKAVGSIGMTNAAGERAANRRAEMYLGLRDWIKRGGAIDNDDGLLDELEAIEYGYNSNNEILLERKEDIKKRLGFSPDDSDSLALTFAEIVVADEVKMARDKKPSQRRHPLDGM